MEQLADIHDMLLSIAPFCFVSAFAFLNRARGSQFFGLLSSTTEARAIATSWMAAITAFVGSGDDAHLAMTFLWTAASLVFWEIWGWGKYFAAEHGNIDPGGGSIRPVDWIMEKLNLPTDTDEQRRVWGTVAMGLRQSLVALCIVGVAILSRHPERAWLAAFSLLLGTPYYLAGKLYPQNPHPLAEMAVGACIGVLIFNCIN